MGITLIRSSKCKVFLPFPFIHSNTINSCHFFPSVFISVSHPDFFFKSNFLEFFLFIFLFPQILQEIVPGGVEEVGVTG